MLKDRYTDGQAGGPISDPRSQIFLRRDPYFLDLRSKIDGLTRFFRRHYYQRHESQNERRIRMVSEATD
jgi:hypothetical protein